MRYLAGSKIIVGAISLLLCLTTFLYAGPANTRVLVVHSYHITHYTHTGEMAQGIEDALAATDAEILHYYMDTARNKKIEWIKARAALAKKFVSQFKPAVVIVMDDNACEYFVKDYLGKEDSPLFVFGGVNSDPATYGFPAANVTGVLEQPNIVESYELAKKLVPGIKKVVLFSDPSDATDQLFEMAQKSLKEKIPVQIIGFEQPQTIDDWKIAITKWKDKVDAISFYSIMRLQKSKTDNTKVMPEELGAILTQMTTLPTIGMVDGAAEAGALCGVSVSMHEQGLQAGIIAKELLYNGKKPADFPVKPTERGRILLNLRTAEKHKIEVPYHIIKRAEVVIR